MNWSHCPCGWLHCENRQNKLEVIFSYVAVSVDRRLPQLDLKIRSRAVTHTLD
jgi:hypothetical protein